MRPSYGRSTKRSSWSSASRAGSPAGDGSAQLGAGRVGLGRLLARWLRRAFAVGHGDEVGGDVVTQQAPRAQLDVRKAGGVEPASTTFADVNRSLRSGPP